EQAEPCSESLVISRGSADHDVLLVSAPIVAWTRYRLPDGKLTAAQSEALNVAFAETVAAEGASIAMLPNLITFDQMPQTFQETRLRTPRLGAMALRTRPHASHVF